MRIAIFSDVFYPELSGISDSVISLAKELANRGHEIKFYVPHYPPKSYRNAGAQEKEPGLGGNISIKRLFSIPYRTGTGQGRFVIPPMLVSNDLKKFNPDVIHSQLFFGAGLEALWMSKKLKKPVIGTNHTAAGEFMKYSPVKGKLAANAVLRYVNWYYGSCDLVTAPSNSVVEEMKSYGFKKDIVVVSNPIDVKTFIPLKNKKELKKKLGFGNFTVIHAGRLADERKVNVLVEAISIVKKEFLSAELALAGTGTAKNELDLLGEKLGIKSSLKFLGFLDKPRLNEAYNASEIFAIASTSDTQSLVMMQALAAGLPVVGVNARALPEYINKNNGFVVEPNNPKLLAEKIIFLFKNPALRKKLGTGARKFSLNFSAENIAEKWEKIYKTAIKIYHKNQP